MWLLYFSPVSRLQPFAKKPSLLQFAIARVCAFCHFLLRNFCLCRNSQGFIRINSTRLKAYHSLRGCPASLKTDF